MNPLPASMHPGSFLREYILPPLGVSLNTLARHLGVQPITVSLLVREKARVTPRLALALERETTIAADCWLALQAHHDLATARARNLRPRRLAGSPLWRGGSLTSAAAAAAPAAMATAAAVLNRYMPLRASRRPAVHVPSPR